MPLTGEALGVGGVCAAQVARGSTKASDFECDPRFGPGSKSHLRSEDALDAMALKQLWT